MSCNPVDEVAFYRIMRSLKQRKVSGFTQESIKIDWVDVDEDSMKAKLSDYVDYSEIVDLVSKLGKTIDFGK